MPVVGGAGLARALAGCPGADQRLQLGETRLDHRFGLRPRSLSGPLLSVALSASISKSACVFPAMSNAGLCFASSSPRRSIFLFALASAAESGFALGRFEPARPAAAALSRPRRHSMM